MDISQIKRLRDEAVPGPWEMDKNPCMEEWYGYVKSLPGGVSVWGDRKRWTDENESTYRFVAALPEIADECIRLMEENEELKKKLENV